MLSLIVFILLVAAAAFTGAQFEPGIWYEVIEKPGFTPPNWIFGPVWTLLYAFIAVAGWLAWKKYRKAFSPPMLAWAAQLILNAGWSWVFFGLNRPFLALIVILLLLNAITAFIFLVQPRSKAAAALFVPYALWVAFATALNFEIARLNP
jgi:translocator protein